MYMNMKKEKAMSKSSELNVKVKIGVKSFITVIAILVAVLICVGILTFIIPAGRYSIYTTDISKMVSHFINTQLMSL